MVAGEFSASSGRIESWYSYASVRIPPLVDKCCKGVDRIRFCGSSYYTILEKLGILGSKAARSDINTSITSMINSEPLLVIVPALNEAGNIGKVIQDLKNLNQPLDILVVDDGSDDETYTLATEMGARVLRMPFNCGIGASVQVGIRFGLENGYSVVARLDGDGQHDPIELTRLCQPIWEKDADFVLGSRYLLCDGFVSTWPRRLGRRWFMLLLRLFCGLRVTDPTSGFWVANRRAATVLYKEHSSDYPEVDSLVHLYRNGRVIQELPVKMRARASGSSSIDWSRTFYYMLKVTIALLIGRVRPTIENESIR